MNTDMKILGEILMGYIQVFMKGDVVDKRLGEFTLQWRDVFEI